MLERVVDLLRVTRQRDSKEAAWWQTDAYARLILADAFARTGQRDRARSLAGKATEALERGTPDEVARFLITAFAARREQALVPLPRAQILPTPVELARSGLDRVHRYKVDRLMEHCRTLVVEPGPLDAIGEWLTKKRAVPQPLTPDNLAGALRALEPGVRASRIAKLFEAGDDSDRRVALAALVELAPHVAFPALGPIVAAARSVSPELCALACFVAARFGYGELVPPLVHRLLASVDDSLSQDAFCAIVYPMLRALRWLALDSDLEALARRIRAKFELGHLPDGPRLIVAGALVALDDPAGNSAFESTIAALPAGALKVAPLAPIRALAAGATYAGRHGHALLARFEPLYVRVTDDFGTNSHFCLSVLYFIDAMAIAYVDLLLATANVLDPEVEPLFASGLVA